MRSPAQVQMVNLSYHQQQEIHVIHEIEEPAPEIHVPCCDKCCCERCCHKCNCCCNGCECCNVKCCLIAIAIIGIILIPLLIGGIVAYFVCFRQQNAGDGPGFGVAIGGSLGIAESSGGGPSSRVAPQPQVTTRNASVGTGCYCC